MKKLATFLFILFGSISFIYCQEPDKELEELKLSEQNQIRGEDQKDGQCTFYLDKILNINVYSFTETIAEFEPRDSEFLRIILQNTILSQEEYKETYYICGSKFCFSIVINETGDVCSYTPLETGSSKRRAYIMPTDKLVETCIKNLKGWKPAMCNGENVTSMRRFTFSTFWFQPKENSGNK